MHSLAAFFDLVGVAFFAIAGALAAGRKHMDIFGVVVVGCVTAIGGGTLRDLLLGVDPVFWIAAPHYVWITAAAAVCTFFLAKRLRPAAKVMMYADAAGLALFTLIGYQKGYDVTQSHGIGIVMGITTGVAGGIVRDVLCGEIPLIFRREIYASASLCGAAVLALVLQTTGNGLLAAALSLSVTLGIRLSAIRWNLSLPVFVLDREPGQGNE